MRFLQRFIVVTAILALALPLFGQTSGRLTGTIMTDNAGLPGVTVTISSPALQGKRTSYTDVNGNYTFSALPPGRYTIVFEMESMQTVTKTADVPLAGTGRADADMKLTAVAEAITVTASAPAVLETTEVQTNIDAQLVADLPLGRNLIATTTLAPGVNSNGPNQGAITISGALASDNLFLVNGAVVNENLRGQPHNLFIEDAIQETTVQTAGISAEYGRFMGGVVSAITKSGGNEFSGSLRDSFQNDTWTENNEFVSPFTGRPSSDPESVLNETYEGTLGGFILRDRLWFFTAGRYFETSADRLLFRSNDSFTYGREQMRLEGKLTAAITQKHNLVGSYLEIADDESNYCFIQCYETSNIDSGRSLPNDFMVLQYNGIFTDKFLVEATYSEKNFAFEESGGDSRDLILGSWFYDNTTGAFGGAPVFCGVCDPEERNNELLTLKATYYLATKSIGTHNIVAGYENWAETRLSNNYQSGSDYHIGLYTAPTRAADGTVLITIGAGDYIGFTPIDVLSKGSDFVTDSIFVNDKWDFNQHFSFNLGVRYDVNDGVDSFGNTVADDSAISPRLGVIYDIQGNGRFRVNASYSNYVNRIAETIGGSSSAAGNPAGYYYEYLGPEVGPLPTFQAFQQAFNWFNSVGGTNNTDLLFFVRLPGVNRQIQESLTSPNVDEYTVGFGSQLGQRGFFRADYINRQFNDFFVVRTDTTTGLVQDALNRNYDLGLVENSDVLEREYNAVQFQAGFRPWTRLNIGGNYTWSETKGNQTGQTGGSGPIADGILQYPEYKAFAQNNPVGFLPQDQEHKVRVWVGYDQPTPIGNFNFSLLQNYDSGTPFSAVGNITIRPYVDNAPLGYVQRPSNVAYYFSDRGEFRWDDVTSTDFAVNYSLPIGPVNLFLQGQVRNLFNEDAVVGGDTTIITNFTGGDCDNNTAGAQACAAFNPFTQTPVEGVHYTRGPLFGKPTNATNWINAGGGGGSFQLPRTYLVGAGIRF